ncbi:Protein of unknown function [Gryllus bimaculatus]|nr:Protein of unknown function [Gryllus bimaculatus]
MRACVRGPPRATERASPASLLRPGAAAATTTACCTLAAVTRPTAASRQAFVSANALRPGGRDKGPSDDASISFAGRCEGASASRRGPSSGEGRSGGVRKRVTACGAPGTHSSRCIDLRKTLLDVHRTSMWCSASVDHLSDLLASPRIGDHVL